jgi:HEAT repeat protein
MNRWMSPLPARRAIALATVALALALCLGSFQVRALESEVEPDVSGATQQTTVPGKAGERANTAASTPHQKAKPTTQEPEKEPELPKVATGKKRFWYGEKQFSQWRSDLVSDLKPEVRIEAIKALSIFGANGYAKEAAEAIIEVMKSYDVELNHYYDRDVIEAAYLGFTKIGSEGVPALLHELKDGKRNGRRFAFAAILRMGPSAEAADPAIIEAFKDEDLYIRRRALTTVHTSEAKRKLLVPALTASLKDADPSSRRLAAERLGNMGQDAKPAIPALIASVNDEDREVRNNALLALRHIGPNPTDIVPVLLTAMKDKDYHFRHYAVQSLGMLGPQAKEAVPALILAFKDEANYNPLVVIQALGNIGPAAREAVPVLADFIQQQVFDSPPQKEARQALKKISQ